MGCEIIKIITDPDNPKNIAAQIDTTTDPEKEILKLGKPEHVRGRLRLLQIKNSASSFGLSALGMTFMGLGAQRIANTPEEWKILHGAFGLLEMLGGILVGYISALDGIDTWKKFDRIKQRLDARVRSAFLKE